MLPAISVNNECKILNCDSLEYLKEKIQVNKLLWITNCKNLKQLPPDIAVRSLHLSFCHSLESIPQTIAQISGYFNISDCEALNELPTGLIVGDSLHIENCPGLKELPRELCCGEDLSLYNTGIKELPSNLIVGDSITVEPQKIETIPNTIKVGRRLFDEKCPQYGFSKNEYCKEKYFYLSAEKRLLLIDSTQQQDGYTVLSFLNDKERIVIFDEEHCFVHSLEAGELPTDRFDFEKMIKQTVQSGLNAAY